MIKFSETKLAHYSMLLIDIEREKPFSKKKKKNTSRQSLKFHSEMSLPWYK